MLRFFSFSLIFAIFAMGCGDDSGGGGGGGCGDTCARIEQCVPGTQTQCLSQCTMATPAEQAEAATCARMSSCTDVISCATGECACDTDFDCTPGCSCDPECGMGSDAGGGFDAGGGGSDAGPPFDAGGSTDNSGEGGSCSCDETNPSQDVNLAKSCSGTEDGCQGFGGSGQLRCLHQIQSGVGICHYFCSQSELGTQGSCPSGYTCSSSHLQDIAGNNWSVCNRD